MVTFTSWMCGKSTAWNCVPHVGAKRLELRTTPVTRSNELVDQVLEEFLAAAFVRRHLTHLQGIRFKFVEADLAFFDSFADAGVPGAVAVPDELAEAAVLADGGGDLEAAREGVHAAD